MLGGVYTVIENEDGTWNVVYNHPDPARVWGEGEEEEEDLPPARLRMAQVQVRLKRRASKL